MNFQQITIAGNLGGQPEMRYTNSGIAVTNFSVAVNKRRKDENGEIEEETMWYRVAAWRGLAETCAEWLEKGQNVLVVGELEPVELYEDRKGEVRASLKVTAREVRFGDKKEKSERAVQAQSNAKRRAAAHGDVSF